MTNQTIHWQLVKKAGGVALELSRSHSQLAVTLSKSEEADSNDPKGVQSERAQICSVLKGRARRYLDSRCRPAVAKADGRFYKSTTGGKKVTANKRILSVTAVELEMHKIRNSKRNRRLQSSSEIHKTDFGCASRR
jgi:hypothetical protein